MAEEDWILDTDGKLVNPVDIFGPVTESNLQPDEPEGGIPGQGDTGTTPEVVVEETVVEEVESEVVSTWRIDYNIGDFDFEDSETNILDMSEENVITIDLRFVNYKPETLNEVINKEIETY